LAVESNEMMITVKIICNLQKNFVQFSSQQKYPLFEMISGGIYSGVPLVKGYVAENDDKIFRDKN
jgi:hypothetical protein